MIYEFKCNDCDKEFEVEMKVSEYVTPICSDCEGTSSRHFRSSPTLDTYYPGSYKDQNPVHGI